MTNLKKYTDEELNLIKRNELMILKEIIRLCEENNLKYYLYGGTALGAIRHKGFIPWDDDIDITLFREDYERLMEILDEHLDEKFEILNSKKQEDYFLPFTKVSLKGTRFEEFWVEQVSFNIGFFIDIFPLDNIPESEFKFKIQYYKCRIYYHLLVNSIVKIETGSKINSFLHKFLHSFLNIIPRSDKFFKKKYLKSLIKYNNIETNFVTDYYSQRGIYIFDKQDFEPSKKVKFESIYANIPKNCDKILTEIYGNYMELPPKDKRFNHAPEVLDFGKYNETYYK